MKDGVKIIGRAKQKKESLAKTCYNYEPTHSELCKAATEYMRLKHPKKLFIHIANEGKRSPRMGKQLKDEGMMPGVYDYLLAYPIIRRIADGLHLFSPGMWIEVKTEKDKLSKAQEAFKQLAIDAYYEVVEVYSVGEFIEKVESYLGYSQVATL